MKYISCIVFSVLLFSAACRTEKENSAHQHSSEQEKEQAPADTIKKSIPKQEHAQLGKTHFTIKYHAPAVRGRTIWGGLVPYDEVWVTGAHLQHP
jgi:hypothetical protein